MDLCVLRPLILLVKKAIFEAQLIQKTKRWGKLKKREPRSGLKDIKKPLWEFDLPKKYGPFMVKGDKLVYLPSALYKVIWCFIWKLSWGITIFSMCETDQRGIGTLTKQYIINKEHSMISGLRTGFKTDQFFNKLVYLPKYCTIFPLLKWNIYTTSVINISSSTW